MSLKGLAFALRAFLAVFLCGCGSCLWAQSSTTGGLTGTVTDSMGAAVPGATVTLVNLATNQTQMTTTDANGGYRFSLLPTDNYGVNFSAQGFKTSQMASVAVNVSEVPVLDAQVEAGESTQQVACLCHVGQAAT